MSFGAIYAFVLRHALANSYLKNYWAFAFPPTVGRCRCGAAWIGAQFTTVRGEADWKRHAGRLLGCLRRRRAVRPARSTHLATAFATVPISLLALAVAGFVPTFERLAIWSVPAFYVGVALCADAGARQLARHFRHRTSEVRGPRFGGHPSISGYSSRSRSLLAAVDIVKRGVFAIEHRPRSNYGLDDRSSVRWLLDQRRPGDAVLSTHYGLAAIWWYAGISVADADRSGRMADGAPLYELHHVADERGCASWRAALDSIARDRTRIVVYLGFRMNVEPEGFDQLVLEEFGRRWPLVGYKEYAEVSRLAIFDLTGTPGGPLVIPAGPSASTSKPQPTPPGCISVTPARRW